MQFLAQNLDHPQLVFCHLRDLMFNFNHWKGHKLFFTPGMSHVIALFC